MTLSLFLILLMAGLPAIAGENAADSPDIQQLRGDDAAQGFHPIFNGHDLSGWAGATDDYEVREGSIVCKPGRGGVLFTEEQYADFVVRLEFKLPPGGNNGLAIRYPGQGQASYDGMCELQVLDDTAEIYADLDPRQYHGSIYGVVAAQRGHLRPVGQWNYQQVTVAGSHIRVELNGQVIVDADVSQVHEFKDGREHPGLNRQQGHFGFAGHGDPVLFRNIAIRQLPGQTAAQTAVQPLADAILLHVPFDGGFDARRSVQDGKVYTTESPAQKEVQAGNQVEAVSIAAGQGRYGDAVRFAAKTDRFIFYRGSELGYQAQDWSGTVSLWMKLDPNTDLEPGYCDPIQLTERAWNDAAFFVDFDKFLPRDFRLGVFPDYSVWNPTDIDWDDLPIAERPMVVVKSPPFSDQEWTHVCFTWQGVNSSKDQPAKASLYLNGKLQGTRETPLKFSWEADKASLMLGIFYIGLMDDLIVFSEALSDEQVAAVYRHPMGGLQPPPETAELKN